MILLFFCFWLGEELVNIWGWGESFEQKRNAFVRVVGFFVWFYEYETKRQQKKFIIMIEGDVFMFMLLLLPPPLRWCCWLCFCSCSSCFCLFAYAVDVVFFFLMCFLKSTFVRSSFCRLLCSLCGVVVIVGFVAAVWSSSSSSTTEKIVFIL